MKEPVCLEESSVRRAERAPRRARFVPEGFLLSEALRAYARDQGLDDAAIAEEERKWRLHEFHKAISDWSRCWMRWARTAAEIHARDDPARPRFAAEVSMFNFRKILKEVEDK